MENIENATFAPGRSELTVETELLAFKHRVQVVNIFTNGRLVIQKVDLASYFSAARFVHKHSDKEIYRIIRQTWPTINLGPPYYRIVKQRSA